jgi:dTDP-glucose 4,6-dehydratase
MNVLITGGCGFIGSNFCIETYKNFNKMIILDSLNYCGNKNNIAEIIEKVIFINKDIVNTNFTELFEKYSIDLIINFAAQTHVDNSYHHLNRFVKDNILTVNVILESVRFYTQKKIKIIHFSTDEIYGESKNTNEFYETSNFNPTNPYSASKASAEMIINSYKISFNMDVLIIRCNNVFGKNQFFEKVIPSFIHKALNNEMLTIHGTNEKVRDFIHTDDVNKAILILIEKGNFNEIYNIGIKNPIKIMDLANYIITKIGGGYIKIIEDRPFNDYRYNINFDKLKTLGWEPNSNFYKKLDEIILFEIKKYENNVSPTRNIIVSSTEKYVDNRGKNIQIPSDIIIQEQFISKSKKNVLRGIHKSPYAKLVTVLSGKIIDYVIDFSKTPPIYEKNILECNGNNQIYIPENYGHLFISLEDDTILLYQLENKYNPLIDININYLDPFINLDININNNFILSEKDVNSGFTKTIDYIILGSSGFLGSEIKNILTKQHKNIICLNTRLDNYDLLKKQFEIYKPKYVICAAGISGNPTIDWCEDNKDITFKTNVIDTLKLCELTNKLNIHLTLFGSGSVFKGEAIHNEYSENSTPNNNSKYYLNCRIILEESIKIYNNILYLRIQYPMSLNKNKKCFMNKMLARLQSVNACKVNITFIPNLFPLLSYIIELNTKGILNFVNPKPIYLYEILEIYKKYNDNTLEYKIKKMSDGCGLLNTQKIEELLLNKNILNIYEAMHKFYETE